VTSVMIADDHPLVRDALTNLLGTVEDISVLGAAANGREAVSMAAETSPDVVLLDLEMPDLDGIEVTRELKAAGSSARIVVLTTFSDRDRILGALDAGAGHRASADTLGSRVDRPRARGSDAVGGGTAEQADRPAP
jgi:DNA-binding NarL/FixJ family response regulator